MRLSCRCLFFVLFLCYISLSYAQGPDTLWTRRYGGPYNDEGYDIQPTSDNGYIITGYAEPFGYDIGPYLYLVRIDEDGDTLWTKTYDTDAISTRGHAVQQTSDGGYITAGFREYPEAYDYDVYLLKSDSFGNTLWTKTYGTINQDFGFSVVQTFDGGYIVVGSANFNGYRMDLYLIKTDSSGDTVWTKTYGGYGIFARAYAVKQTPDSGYIVAGFFHQMDSWTKAWLLKTDPHGDTLWTKMYSYNEFDAYAYALQITSDSGYIMSGEAIYGYYDRYTYLVRTDQYGDTLWTRRYQGSLWALADIYGRSVQQTPDGGYIIVGTRQDYSLDIYLIRTDSRGDTLWTQTYGDDDDQEIGNSIQITADGNYIIAGFKDSIMLYDKNVYVIKTQPDNPGVADRYALEPYLLGLRVYPNPFKEMTDIRYEMTDMSNAEIKIYDATGCLVRQWDNSTLKQSDHIFWDGTDRANRKLSNGVYFIELRTDEYAETSKLMLIR